MPTNSAPALPASRTAAEVRKALVRELRAERDALSALDLRTPGRLIARIQARAIAAAQRDPSLMELDRNGVSQLEVGVMHAVSEVLMRSYWPSVAQMFALGRDKAMKAKSVEGLEYDELLDLYDSIHARLTRESIGNTAWRLASVTLQAARRVPRGN